MKDKLYAIAALVVGVGLLVFGVSELSSDDVKCGGKSMSSSDTCHSYHRKSGGAETRSVDEQRDSNDRSGWTSVAIGTAMGVGGAVWTRSAFRTKQQPNGG